MKIIQRPKHFNTGRTVLVLAIAAALLFVTLIGSADAQSTAVPETTPDAADGLSIHAERCANCHGELGLGDGELAADLANPPSAHASPEFIRAAVPADLFDTITNGRIEKGMPPFGPSSSNPLSDGERWDVIAALFSLGTPLESVEQGQAVYEQNCLSCHGESGKGDGPEAAGLGVDVADLSALDAWSVTSNQAVYDRLSSGAIKGHDFDLEDDDLWSTVDYIRTFGYQYTDALARLRPLETAAIDGQVINGTTGDTLPAGTEVVLRAFTSNLEMTLTLTETLDEAGGYQFELVDVSQEWFFRAGVNYGDIEFGSEFGQLTFDEPELNLPIMVYDMTSDPSVVVVRQHHLVLGFDAGQLLVSELYIIGNDAAAVFAGETGDPSQGTFRIALPDGAEDISFQRGFGNMDSFIPADEVIVTDDGWADTMTIRPGANSTILLVQYAVPYDREASISHPVYYDTLGRSLILPEVGVELNESDGWQNNGQQTMGTGNFVTYSQNSQPAGSTLTLNLQGRPRLSVGSTSNLIGDNSTELIIGVVAALVVVGVVAVIVRQWRLEPDEAPDSDELLQAIADLDDEYEAGEIDEETYRKERATLKAELLLTWEEEERA